MTLFEKLQNLGLPVIAVSDKNEVTIGVMTLEQMELYQDALLEFFYPIEYAGLVQDRQERQDFKVQFQNVLGNLDAIINATSPTNAQIINAVKYLAEIQKKLLKLIERSLL